MWNREKREEYPSYTANFGAEVGGFWICWEFPAGGYAGAGEAECEVESDGHLIAVRSKVTQGFASW